MTACVASARPVSFKAAEGVCAPEDGVASHLWWVRHGAVKAQAAASAGQPGGAPAFELESGEMFPIGAVIGRRAVTSVYRAAADLACLRLDAEAFLRLVQAEPVLADYVNGRLQHLLALSQRALQGWWGAQALAPQPLDQTQDQTLDQLFERPLSALPRRTPVAVSPQDSLDAALRLMHEHGAVSYTPLRAHETKAKHVCRHLLEKKKKTNKTNKAHEHRL